MRQRTLSLVEKAIIWHGVSLAMPLEPPVKGGRGASGCLGDHCFNAGNMAQLLNALSISLLIIMSSVNNLVMNEDSLDCLHRSHFKIWA